MIASQLIQASARAALEHYKIRDTSKGMSFSLPIITCNSIGERADR
jgi:hypothetical protein